MINFLRLSVLLCISFSGTLQAQVNVDTFGAAGNGSTDDSDAITAAIQSAGEGGIIEFTNGKTYMVCKVLKPLKDQTIDLKNATMRRCNEVVTSVQSYNGAGIWTVDDASGYEIGMWLSVSSNGGYDVTSGPLEILGISGNEITSSASLQEPLPNSSMSSDSPFFSIAESGVTLKNFIFDGNYPNNNSILKWDTSVMVLVAGASATIMDGTVRSIPGDFLRFAIGSDGSLIENVSASDGSGVFVHLSGIGFEGTEGITIRGNNVSNLGQEAQRQDHAEGAIEWSFDVGNVYVMDNEFRDLPFAAIRLDDDPRAEEVLIRNNTARNTQGFVTMLKLFEDYDDSDVQVLEISDNILVDTRMNFIHVSSFPAPLPEPIRSIKIFNNQGVNTHWDVQGVENFEFKDNEMVVNNLNNVGGPFDFFFSQATLRMRAMGNALVEGNTFTGNWRQVSIENRGQVDGLGYVDKYDIRDNTFEEFLYSAIQGRANSNGIGGNNQEVDWTTSNNKITSSVLGEGTGISPSGIATIFPAGGEHSGNCVAVGSDATDTFATFVYGLNADRSEGDGGRFNDNVFSNQNGRAGSWGGGDQGRSLLVSNTTLTDNITLDFVNANGGSETGSIIDTGAACDPPGVVNLNSPQNGATNQILNPGLAWQEVSFASTYQIHVSKLSDFSTIEIDLSVQNRGSIQVGPLENATEYFWRVRAQNNIGFSEWSSARSFSTEGGIILPGIVNLSSPANEAVDQEVSLTLEWMSANDSNSYRLQVSDDAGFSNLILDNSITSGTSFDLSGLTVSQEYWWRVKGVNDDGESPSWSDAWKFTTKATNTAAGDEIPELAKVELYPNPASRTLTINLGDRPFESFRIFDSLGRTVKSRSKAEGLRGRIDLNVESLPTGAFFVEIVSEKGEFRIIPLAILR